MCLRSHDFHNLGSVSGARLTVCASYLARPSRVPSLCLLTTNQKAPSEEEAFWMEPGDAFIDHRDDGIPCGGFDAFTARVAIWRQLDAGIRIRVITSSVSGECHASSIDSSSSYRQNGFVLRSTAWIAQSTGDARMRTKLFHFSDIAANLLWTTHRITRPRLCYRAMWRWQHWQHTCPNLLSTFKNFCLRSLAAYAGMVSWWWL